MNYKIKMVSGIAVVILLFTGCTEEKKDQTAELMALALLGSNLESSNGSTLSGYAMKGPIKNAVISVYRLSEEGEKVELYEETTTDSSGAFRFQNPYGGERLELEVSSGEYIDEATGETVRLRTQDRLRLWLSSTEATDGDVTISPLTTMAVERARYRLNAGESDMDGAIVRSREEIASMFGISDVDPGKIGLDDLTDPEAGAQRNRAQTRYGLVIAGLSQVMSDSDVDPADMFDLLECYAEDVQDGEIDGATDSVSISCDGSITAQLAHTNMYQAMNHFMNSERNKHQNTLAGMDIPSPSSKP